MKEHAGRNIFLWFGWGVSILGAISTLWIATGHEFGKDAIDDGLADALLCQLLLEICAGAVCDCRTRKEFNDAQARPVADMCVCVFERGDEEREIRPDRKSMM